jgi:hypothetical protein
MRRKITAFLLASCLLLTALSVLVGFEHFSDRSYFDYGKALVSGLSFTLGQTSANATGEQDGNMIDRKSYTNVHV